MGIRVEMEHTDDPEKAKKIALDHLAENPFYYTQLKLSGVDVKATPSKEKQYIAKKKDEAELVDKDNQMKPVKDVEKVKASANKAKKETNKTVKGVSSMSLVAKTVRGVKKMDATGEKMKKIKENLESTYDAAEELAKQMGDYDSAVVALQDEMGLDPRTADQIASQAYPGTSVPQRIFAKNANITKGLKRIAGIEEEKLREAIRKMIKQETFDGRDNLTDTAGHQLDELSSQEQAIVDDITSALNEGMFSNVLDKIKNYAKKGLLTVAIISSLLGGTMLSLDQKQDVVDAVKTEMPAKNTDLKYITDAWDAYTTYKYNKEKADQLAQQDPEVADLVYTLTYKDFQKRSSNEHVSIGKDYQNAINKLNSLK